MSVQSREARVFAALLASVTVGAIVLMALGNDPPSVGAFSLSSYNRLDPVDKAVIFHPEPLPGRWNSVRIRYAPIAGRATPQTGSRRDSAGADVNNSHFIVCNGRLGGDGQIQPTEKWRRQLPITPDRTGRAGGQTIHICVITETTYARPTDYQIKRTEALAEELYRVFEIQPEFIIYPPRWR